MLKSPVIELIRGIEDAHFRLREPLALVGDLLVRAAVPGGGAQPRRCAATDETTTIKIWERVSGNFNSP